MRQVRKRGLTAGHKTKPCSASIILPFQQKCSFFKSSKITSPTLQGSRSPGAWLGSGTGWGQLNGSTEQAHSNAPASGHTPPGSEFLQQIKATLLLTSNTHEHPQPRQSPSPTSKLPFAHLDKERGGAATPLQHWWSATTASKGECALSNPLSPAEWRALPPGTPACPQRTVWPAHLIP